MDDEGEGTVFDLCIAMLAEFETALGDDYARVVLNEDDIGFGELGGLGGGRERSVCMRFKKPKRVSTLANRNLKFQQK